MLFDSWFFLLDVTSVIYENSFYSDQIYGFTLKCFPAPCYDISFTSNYYLFWQTAVMGRQMFSGRAALPTPICQFSQDSAFLSWKFVSFFLNVQSSLPCTAVLISNVLVVIVLDFLSFVYFWNFRFQISRWYYSVIILVLLLVLMISFLTICNIY